MFKIIEAKGADRPDSRNGNREHTGELELTGLHHSLDTGRKGKVNTCQLSDLWLGGCRQCYDQSLRWERQEKGQSCL